MSFFYIIIFGDFIRLIIMTKYMKYDNMIITIYFDNQTKYCQRLKRIDKGLKKI